MRDPQLPSIEEHSIVQERAKIFEGCLRSRVSKDLANVKKRHDYHPLYYSLASDGIWPRLETALMQVKAYAPDKYLRKASSKLANAVTWLDQQAAVGEIIVVGYYCGKFINTETVVDWEANTAGPDITINNSICLEITAIHDNQAQLDFFSRRHSITLALQEAVRSIQPQQYSYDVRFGEGQIDWTESDVNDFIQYVLAVRKKGEGQYRYSKSEKITVTLIVRKLNKLHHEYASSTDTWSSFLKDWRRLRDKIVDKAREQLSNDKTNYILVPNYAGLDEIDCRESLWGQEIFVWGANNEMMGPYYQDDINHDDYWANAGAASIIKHQNLPIVEGLFYFGYDYDEKQYVQNPFIEEKGKILDLLT